MSWLTVGHRRWRRGRVRPSPGRRWPPHGPFRNPPRPPCCAKCPTVQPDEIIKTGKEAESSKSVKIVREMNVTRPGSSQRRELSPWRPGVGNRCGRVRAPRRPGRRPAGFSQLLAVATVLDVPIPRLAAVPLQSLPVVTRPSSCGRFPVSFSYKDTGRVGQGSL